MRYELLLQAAPGEPFDEVAALETLAVRRPVTPEPGVRIWKLTKGEVELHPLREAGKTVALEIHVPLAESDELLRDALQEAASAALEAGRVVYDPQLNRPVTRSDVEAVAAQYSRTARYAADMVGVPGLTGMGVNPEPPRMKAGLKVALGLVGFVVFLLFLSSWLTRLTLGRALGGH